MTSQPRDSRGRFVREIVARRAQGREEHGKSGTVAGLV